MGYIYKITHKDTGMSYIGLSIDYEKRWNAHMNETSDNMYFHNALKKYGEDAFTWEILIICFDDDMGDYEKEYIKKYNTIRPNGYNLTEGGERGWRHHPDTLARIKASKAGKGNHRPPGFKNSDETKLRMSASRQAYCDAETPEQRASRGKKGGDTRRGKPNPKRGVDVVQFKDGVEIARFPSSMEAGRQTDINYKNIHAVCKGEKWKKTAGGFAWKFAYVCPDQKTCDEPV
jgi:group I intron endonuclease